MLLLLLFKTPDILTGGNLKPWLQAIVSYLRGPGPDDITSLNEIAADYSLSQNYPNPFNPVTKIKFSIPKNEFVSLKIYDIAGDEVMTLISNDVKAGSYSVDFNGSLLSSGVYFYRLETGNFLETKKMILVK
jgi:hypothetical protein